MTGNGRLAFVVGLAAGLAVAVGWPGATRGALSADSGGGPAAPAAAVVAASERAAVVAQPIDPLAPLTLAEARAIVAGAIARAESRGQRLAAAVVDEGGHVIAHERMDGASPSSGKGALGKAFAAAMRRQTTQAMSEQLNTRPDIYYGIINLYPGEVYLVGGGQPLLVNGRVVGAAGAAGLPIGEDDEAVSAGIAAWRQMRPGAGQ